MQTKWRVGGPGGGLAGNVAGWRAGGGQGGGQPLEEDSGQRVPVCFHVDHLKTRCGHKTCSGDVGKGCGASHEHECKHEPTESTPSVTIDVSTLETKMQLCQEHL